MTTQPHVAASDWPGIHLARRARETRGRRLEVLGDIGAVESHSSRLDRSPVRTDGSLEPPIIGIPPNSADGTSHILGKGDGLCAGDVPRDRSEASSTGGLSIDAPATPPAFTQPLARALLAVLANARASSATQRHAEDLSSKAS